MSRLPWGVAVVGLALAAGACRAPDTASGRAVTDDLGRTVQVPTPPTRVVSLAPSLTEVVVAAGGLRQLAARTPYDSVPAPVLRLPAVSTYPVDREAIVALGADLVLGTDQINDPSDGDALGALGVPAVYFHFDHLADVSRVIRSVGALLGTSPPAERAARQFEKRLSAFRPTGPRPRVLVLIGDDVLYAFGGASYVHDMVALAGGRSVTDGFTGESVTLSPEWVLDQSPDWIVVLAGPTYEPSDLTRSQPTWSALPALSQGRVCGVDPDLVVRPGPRLADGIDALAACLDGTAR